MTSPLVSQIEDCIERHPDTDTSAELADFLKKLHEYEAHRMDDGNMPHDVGCYCECPECTGELDDA